METIDLDGEEASDGLLSLVIAVVELLVEALEEEALRRMQSGSLTDEEIERLGTQLAAINDELERLKAETGLQEDVQRLRTNLSDLLEDALQRVDAEPHPGFSFVDDVRPPDPQQTEQSTRSTPAEQSVQSKQPARSAMHRPPVRTEDHE